MKNKTCPLHRPPRTVLLRRDLVPRLFLMMDNTAPGWLPPQAAKRPDREHEGSEGGTRAPRRRAGGALGYVVSALHDALGADAPLESGAAGGKASTCKPGSALHQQPAFRSARLL